jgi:hypothetical protein
MPSPSDAAHSAGTDYGARFTCALARDNIFATQFHPEKSAEHGLALYRNFLPGSPDADRPSTSRDPDPHHAPPRAMLLIPAIDLKDGQCVRLNKAT